MTRTELRFALLKMVWPTGEAARGADPAHYQAKVEELEQWLMDAGHPETDPDEAPKRPRGRPRKRDPHSADTSLDLNNTA